MDVTVMYRAIAARDRRFEGRFVVAVHTTGIYCRPGCPARTPKRENIRFYLTAAGARSAGFRACLRCRPDEVD
jgi:AraC family transcriptional regulator of adaptative response / DNA-3-methyladenine glycosylase II